MSTMETAAKAFFEACETGKGWTACQQFCTPDASFSCQADALAEVKTLEQARTRQLDRAADSLRRLDLEYIDLLYVHAWDFTTPVDEVMRALDDLVRSGKVRYLGASSMAAWQFATALFTADATPTWASSTAASTVAVSGATVIVRPIPSTTVPGRTPAE